MLLILGVVSLVLNSRLCFSNYSFMYFHSIISWLCSFWMSASKIFSVVSLDFFLLSLICLGFLYHGQFFFILHLWIVVLLAMLVWVDHHGFFFFLWFGMYCFSLWSLKVSVEESVVFLMDFPLNETFSLQFSILFLLLFPHILNVLTVICCGEFLFLPWIPGTCVLLCLYGYVFS